MNISDKINSIENFTNKPKSFNIDDYSIIEKEVYEFLQLYILERGVLSDKNKKIKDAISKDQPIIDLRKVLPIDLELLVKIHVLLHKKIQDFRDSVKREIRRIRHTSSQKFVTNHNKVHGKIDWCRTYQERYSRGFNDPTLFMCKESSKNYDLPENLILKNLLLKLDEALKDTEVTKLIPQNEQKKYWTNELYLLKRVLNDLEKNVYINKISNIKKLPIRIENKIRMVRKEFYRRTVLEAYQFYKEILELQKLFDNIEHIKEVIKETYITPSNLDELFEIYILFKTIKHFSADEYRAIKKGKKNIASFKVMDIFVKIYYNHLPEGFDGIEYKKIVRHYRLLEKSISRRPDIIIEFEKNGQKDYIIIEVKFTDDIDYITDSIYKVIGYVKDFNKNLKSERQHAVLAVWDYQKIDENIIGLERDLIVNITNNLNYDKKIVDLIKKIEIPEKRLYI